jgi:flagellar L-ring protein precursor FlgH
MLTMRRIAMLGAVAGLLAGLGGARAESLWERRDPYFAYMFWDTHARRVGDVLTIQINESTSFDGREDRKLSKDTKLGAIMKLNMDYKAGQLTERNFQGNFDGLTTSQRQLNGKADYRSDRTLTDRMAVQVVQVMPNGNLVIEGFRTRVVAGEERTMRVSGVVRPTDIGARNVVESQFISNFTIEYFGRGTDSSYINNGWLGRILNRIWPF